MARLSRQFIFHDIFKNFAKNIKFPSRFKIPSETRAETKSISSDFFQIFHTISICNPKDTRIRAIGFDEFVILYTHTDMTTHSFKNHAETNNDASFLVQNDSYDSLLDEYERCEISRYSVHFV